MQVIEHEIDMLDRKMKLNIAAPSTPTKKLVEGISPHPNHHFTTKPSHSSIKTHVVLTKLEAAAARQR